ncbi:MAG: cyclic nucleotide-binding domain-containing protein [Spirochaetota bacterium]
MQLFTNDDYSILQQSEIFHNLSTDDIEDLCEYCELLERERGKLLLAEGSAGNGLYIILDGSVEIYLPKNTQEGNDRISEVHIAVLKRKDCFGEYSLIDHDRASASIRAKTSLRLCYISTKKFQQLVDENYKTGRYIYENLLHLFVHRLRNNIKELDVAFVLR